ncbi:hypothetical protein SS1G_12914 [Sclerotinia sclerotiorum 1980 UF-70]|uniref:Uncharacterized protein n=1 Tax=Sclerotinia sclerotiorum (strain ATCC 18683 / 1980 / Ss-1) TaxID=665079 RepID=A7F5N6_SCLS1|nr:hypothetical protein SS1G_12914 [Sclerotinia sclerotiorum 1980 UF-70]EDN98057.1 hypothetical protein SS1G_12914 [Sclerotinia sclerotiorum 1980 UF-70]
MPPLPIRERKEIKIRTPNNPEDIPRKQKLCKEGISYDLVLNLANMDQIDIITIQKPYIYKDTSKKITKTHLFYKIFTLLND